MAKKIYYSKAQRTYAHTLQVNEYHNKVGKAYKFIFNKEKDKDVIDALDKAENKTDYVRKLIRISVAKEEISKEEIEKN